jgi:hypothetical protein
MEAGEPVVTERDVADRRTFTWRTVMYGFLYSRRRESRREEDDDVFIDWHHPWVFAMAVGTMILSVADAFLTLQLIDLGMIEANPVMASVMGHSTLMFTVSKMTMTAFGVFALVFLARATVMRHFRTGQLLTLTFSTYLCLICYEFVHLLRLS